MKYYLPLTLLVVVSACTAPRTPNARRLDGDQTHYLVTDARQRIVASTRLGTFSRPGLADPGEIVCSEPSPDVATAIATTFSGALSVLGKGSGSLSTGQVESMAQLVERTASIQLLRDKMYQSCLAYANGAISGTTYSMIMAQLDSTIVSLLLGENAVAAFGRSGATIGGKTGASGSASTSGPGGAQDMDKAVKAVEEAQTKLLAAENERAKVVEKKALDCEKEKDSEAAEKKACKEIEDEESKVAAAKNHLNATLRVLQMTAVVQSNANAESVSVTGIGGLARTPSAELARELRLMQDNFLQQDPNDLFLPTCMVELGLHNQQGTLGRAMDWLVGGIQTARADVVEAKEAVVEAVAKAALSSGPSGAAESKEEAALVEKARVRTSLAESALVAAENKLTLFLADPDSLLQELGKTGDAAEYPHKQLFDEVYKRWRSNGNPLTSEEGGEEIAAVSAAANLNRRSALAEACVEQLPAHLIYTRKFSERYRMARLASQERIEIATAGNQDTIERARLLQQFQGAVSACKEVAEKNRESCQLAAQKVLSPD